MRMTGYLTQRKFDRDYARVVARISEGIVTRPRTSRTLARFDAVVRPRRSRSAIAERSRRGRAVVSLGISGGARDEGIVTTLRVRTAFERLSATPADRKKPNADRRRDPASVPHLCPLRVEAVWKREFGERGPGFVGVQLSVLVRQLRCQARMACSKPAIPRMEITRLRL